MLRRKRLPLAAQLAFFVLVAPCAPVVPEHVAPVGIPVPERHAHPDPFLVAGIRIKIAEGGQDLCLLVRLRFRRGCTLGQRFAHRLSSYSHKRSGGVEVYIWVVRQQAQAREIPSRPVRDGHAIHRLDMTASFVPGALVAVVVRIRPSQEQLDAVPAWTHVGHNAERVRLGDGLDSRHIVESVEVVAEQSRIADKKLVLSITELPGRREAGQLLFCALISGIRMGCLVVAMSLQRRCVRLVGARCFDPQSARNPDHAHRSLKRY